MLRALITWICKSSQNPFLNYNGAQLLSLDKWSDEEIKHEIFPAYEQAFSPEKLEPSELNAKTISRLFFDSFAISVWKKAEGTKWPLRVNPSSGNLHPTEVYLISGPVNGLIKSPSVCHYAPLPHALELRAEFSLDTWEAVKFRLSKRHFFRGFYLNLLASFLEIRSQSFQICAA